MTETQTSDGDQSTEENKTSNVDLSEIQTAIMAELDKRFQGFQGILDRRNDDFQKELEQLKTANLPPEEQEQLQASKTKQELDRIKRENELLRMRRQFPEEVDLLEDFFKKSSLQEQLDLLSTFRKAKAEAEAQGDDTEEQPTPVDKNNPTRKRDVSLADLAGGMTSDLAEKILGQSSERGLLRRLRGG